MYLRKLFAAKNLLPLLASIFISAISINAQQPNSTNAKWVRIESENKDFSADVPADFVVDADKKDSGQTVKVYGSQNGVFMEIAFFKESDPKLRLERTSLIEGYRPSEFRMDNFKGKMITSDDAENFYFKNVYLASKKGFYKLKVESSDKKAPEIFRFLLSVKVDGKLLFQAGENVYFQADLISVKDLKTSEQVTEAIERKIVNQKIPAEIKKLSELPPPEDGSKLSSPVLIIEKPYPTFRPNFSALQTNSRSYFAKLRVSFLANGQIGKITAYSDSDKGFVNACIEAARKIKFVPALVGKTTTDAEKIVDYSLQFQLMRMGTVVF